MNKIRMAVSFALLLMSSYTFAATLESLTKAQVQEYLVNKKIAAVPGQVATFSLFFTDKGIIKGEASNPKTSIPNTDQGKYSIDDDGTIHIQWDHWEGRKNLCMRLFATKNAFIAVNCDDVWETVFLRKSIQ